MITRFYRVRVFYLWPTAYGGRGPRCLAPAAPMVVTPLQIHQSIYISGLDRPLRFPACITRPTITLLQHRIDVLQAYYL